MAALQLEGIFTLNFLHCHSPGNFKIFFIYLTAVHSSDCNLFHNILRFHKKKKKKKKKSTEGQPATLIMQWLYGEKGWRLMMGGQCW